MQLHYLLLCSNTFPSLSLCPKGINKSLIFKHQRLAEDLIYIISLTQLQIDHVVMNNSIRIPIYNLNV